MKSTVLKTAIMYGIGVGALAWVLVTNWDPKSGSPGLREAFRRPINPGPLVLATLIAATSLLLTFIRWHLLVRAQGLAFSRRDAIRLGLIGYYFNTFLPGSVGGDIVKAVGIARDQERRTVAVATVLIDRAVGLWALVWFVALLGSAFWLAGDPVVLQNPHLQFLVRAAVVIVAGTLAVWVVLGLLPQRRATRFASRLEGIPKVGGSLAELWRAMWMYRSRPRAVFEAMLLSMVGHTGWVLTFHFSAQVFDVPDAEGATGSLTQHFLIVPVGMVIQALFPSPGGVGGGEAAFGWLYSLLGKPEVNGILGCLGQRIVSWVIALIGAIIFTRLKRELPVNGNGRDKAELADKKEEPPEEVPL